MALEAKRGLRGLQQRLCLAGVNVVATDATDAGLGMRRTVEVGMCSRVATQAIGVHIFGRGLGGIENLGHVAAAVHVRLARAVAALAGCPGFAMLQGYLGMRIVGELLGHLVMAGGAGFAAHIIRGIGILDRRGSRLVAGRRSRQHGNAQHSCAQNQHPTSSQSRHLARSRTNQQLRDRPIFMHQNTASGAL